MINLSKIPYPQRKKLNLVGEFHKYTISKGISACMNRGVRTENINTCVGGVLNAGAHNFMFHAAPEMQALTSIRRELSKQVESLRETCENVTGFICGGLEFNIKDKEAVQSFDLYNTIAEVLDDLGVKFTMLCGKEKGAPMENIYAINSNINVWSDSFKKLMNKRDVSEEELQKMLEDKYQFIEKPDEQVVNIVDSFAPKAQNLV